VRLESVDVLATPSAIHLRYRVLRGSAARAGIGEPTSRQP
jgi:hypothetical protein